MRLPSPGLLLPSWQNALLSIISAILLTLTYPNFDLWYLAWFVLVPFFWAIDRESGSVGRCFVLGWLFGTVFFFGTCWWLTFAPITYAAFPWALAYFLLLCVTAAAGLSIGIFAAILAALVRRFGTFALLSAPFIWVFVEFVRYWLTGNNWNAVGYSQAFGYEILQSASIGGVYLVSFAIVLVNAFLLWSNKRLMGPGDKRLIYVGIVAFWISFTVLPSFVADRAIKGGVTDGTDDNPTAMVVAVQPNVPMNGLDQDTWRRLRQQQVTLAETEVVKIRQQGGVNSQVPITVILPESPMNFMFAEDVEFRTFIQAFAARNRVSVLFNSAEPDKSNRKYFNSAVMIDPSGRVAAQYDKIYLLPFGEAVPVPLESIMPAFVGSFSYGKEYDLLPLGDARAGIMICFESHFGQMSREYVRNGADVLIEMTNDGYLGPTPVLRQHLANAVFRAVETNRPVLRVTNVGITAYVNELGDVKDPAHSYSEDTRVWTVSKSDGKQTFYVKYGDWFAWLCSIVTLGLLVFGNTWAKMGTIDELGPKPE